MTTNVGLVFFPAYDWAISRNHPEREERLLYTHDQLKEEGLFDLPEISEHKPIMAKEEDISAVHFCPPHFSTVVEAPHYISAGAAIHAGELVLSGKTKRAFALTRPPGHHAMRVIQGGRGFCAVNIEAIMIQKLRQTYGAKRIAIVDTDCHHGDGTQDIYWHDPDTLFISLHQDGRTLYPGTGFIDEAGGPKALGSTINIPLPPETGDAGYLYAVQHIVRPILDAWKPDLIINSAGQDNHFTDPITNMRLTARGYGDLITAISPDISVLEGGYAIQGALPYVNLAVVLAMANLDYSHIIEPSLSATNKGFIETSSKTMDYIKKIADTLMSRTIEHMHHGYTHRKGWFEKEKSLYYDTHGISEYQKERLRDCPDCHGLLCTETQTDKRKRSLCLLTPHAPCEACQNTAEDFFTKAQHQGMCVEYIEQKTGAYRRAN